MANIIESRVTLEDEVFEEAIDTMEEPIEVVRPSSYNDLEDLPQVNGVTLMGNKTSEELGIVTATDIENAVSAEATLRENADTALGGRINDEATDRENADTTLGGRIDGEITNRTNADNALGTRIDNEILARQGGDNNLQIQIDAITSKSDVVDVVADYAALQAYDTQHLGNNDVIKVLDDETHDNAQTYYRWNKTVGTWSYIGSEAPYYSKGQMDTILQAKQDKLIAGANIQIAQDGKTISATDTTYTAGNGLNLNGTEFSADTTVLATKSDLDSYYTKTATDTKLAPKIEAEVVASLPTTGDSSKLYLTPKAHTTQTATGNPVTATVEEEAGAIESFQLDGNTFQQTYTGKNKIGFQDMSGTCEGVTYSIVDGLITLNGTSTASVTVFLPITTLFNLTAGNKAFAIIPVSGSWNSGWVGVSARDSSDVQVTFQQVPYNGTHQSVVRDYTPDMVSRIAGFRMYFASDSSFSNYKFYIQIVDGSTVDTDYEPFVGGQPSPSPDYPQPIQTVTGKQTVEVVGKNLIDPDGLELGNIDASGNDSDSQKVVRSGYIRVAAGSYTLKVNNSDNNINLWRYAIYDNSKTFVSANTPQAKSATITIANNGYIRVSFYNAPWKDLTVQEIIGSQVQLELGSTASSYTPYSKQTLPLDLGTIELCKLGDYQDYIYKDGDDWKVHKATTTKIFSGAESEDWNINNSGTENFWYRCRSAATGSYGTPDNSRYLCCNYESGAQITSSNTANGVFVLSGGDVRLRYGTEMSLDNWKAKLATTNMVLTYALATATDTAITDTTLIAQLEAIRTASLENGANTITNTATAPNLAGDMEVGYYGYNPTNRYDKFIWLDLNNAYEQINNPDTSSTLSTLSTRSLGTTAEQPTVTRSLDTETITLKKGETEPIEEKTELPTILDEETEETETTEPEESDGTDER